MRLVAVGDGLVGKRLAKSVLMADGRALLRAGTQLTAEYVKNLHHRGFRAVYVQNELLPDLPFDGDLREEVRVRATEEVHHAARQVEHGREVDVRRVRGAVSLILDEVRANGDLLYGLAVVRSADDYTFTHSVNVAVMSLAIGLRSGLVHGDLVKLGVGALLHDIGKALVPRDVLLKTTPLTATEQELLEAHTTLGFRALREDTPELSPLSTNVALSHHERLDGSGYPRHIRGDQIHVFSKIVAVADVWEAMVSNRVYRSPLPQVEAAQELRAGAGRLYDEEMVKRLLLRTAVFPTGSIVRLSDGRAGVVSAQDYDRPEQPEVTLLFDRRNQPLEPSTVRVGEGDVEVVGILEDLPEPVRSGPSGPHHLGNVARS